MSVSLCSSAVERALMLADTCLKNHRYIEETYHPLSGTSHACRHLDTRTLAHSAPTVIPTASSHTVSPHCEPHCQLSHCEPTL